MFLYKLRIILPQIFRRIHRYIRLVLYVWSQHRRYRNFLIDDFPITLLFQLRIFSDYELFIIVYFNTCMTDLQSHDYFELYILLEGTRLFFIDDKFFSVVAPAVCIISPFRMHKTEGDAYKRVNINVSPNLLTVNEKSFLNKLGEKVAFKLDAKKSELFLSLLEKSATYASHKTLDKQPIESFIHVLLYLLQQDSLLPFTQKMESPKTKSNSIITEIIEYIGQHYKEDFSINDLCKRFFISKNTLCSQFRSLMHCSIMQYRMFIRISKAKELLNLEKKNLNAIAAECGFSSANYFSLIFKKEVGISPNNYRKAK